MDLENGGGKIDMKRKWNWPIWIGFIVAVGGLFSYEFFAQFPVTRDFPWANLLFFGIGATLLLVGLFRAFGRPQLYRGTIFGSIFTAISVVCSRSLLTKSSMCFDKSRSPHKRRGSAKKRRSFHCPTKMASQ